MAYGPGRGGPARGNGGHWGGPAKGFGWGGPARGSSTSRIRCGDPDGIRAMRHDPERIAVKAQRTAELEEVLYSVATAEGSSEMLRVNAASKLLDRIEGQPVARKVSTNADAAALKSMPDAELARMVEEER
jgi:hypothetical protein